MIKRGFIKILSMIMVLLMIISNCSFASIVSDNDGTAFVTKAEFDTLKKISINKYKIIMIV